MMPKVGRNRTTFGRALATSWPNSVDVGRARPNLGESGPGLVDSGPKLTEFRRSGAARVRFVAGGPFSAQLKGGG